MTGTYPLQRAGFTGETLSVQNRPGAVVDSAALNGLIQAAYSDSEARVERGAGGARIVQKRPTACPRRMRLGLRR